MDPSVAPRSGRTAQRDEGLVRVRRLTKAAAVGAVGGVAVLAGYVAHAVPGRHASSAPGATAPSPAGSAPSTSAPPSSSGSAGGGGITPGTDPSGPSATLAPPTTAPQPSRYVPQVVSGAS